MDFGERLKAKVGPLPVWAWGLIAGGLFTVWYWVSQRDSVSGTDSGTEEGTVETPSGDFSTVPIVPPGDVIEDENTNQEWLIQALNKASEVGASYVAAQIALSKYLNGETLTTTEETIVNRVIGLIGPPPEGTFGTPEVTPETPPKPAAPAADYSTNTTLLVKPSARYGGSHPVRVSVNWNQKSGKIPRPVGYAVITVGKKTYRKRLIAGQAVQIISVKKGDARLSGNRVVISAKFEPPSDAKYTKGSAAAPKTVLYK